MEATQNQQKKSGFVRMIQQIQRHDSHNQCKLIPCALLLYWLISFVLLGFV